MDAQIEVRKKPSKQRFENEHDREHRVEAKRKREVQRECELLDAKESVEGVQALRIRL